MKCWRKMDFFVQEGHTNESFSLNSKTVKILGWEVVFEYIYYKLLIFVKILRNSRHYK